ncbi:MAG: CrcB family protein [Myxococcota bacterium]
MEWLVVGVGGAVGALLRHWVSLQLNHDFPWGTMAANAAGCFLLALLASWALGHGLARDHLILRLLGTGGLGALTTYSTFNLELISLASAGRWAASLLYGALTLVLCLALGLLGWSVGRLITSH